MRRSRSLRCSRPVRYCRKYCQHALSDLLRQSNIRTIRCGVKFGILDHQPRALEGVLMCSALRHGPSTNGGLAFYRSLSSVHNACTSSQSPCTDPGKKGEQSGRRRSSFGLRMGYDFRSRLTLFSLWHSEVYPQHGPQDTWQSRHARTGMYDNRLRFVDVKFELLHKLSYRLREKE